MCSTQLPGASWDGAGLESLPLHPQERERSPQPFCLARAAPSDAVPGRRSGTGRLLARAQMRFVHQIQRPALPGASSPLQAPSSRLRLKSAFFCLTGTSPCRDRLALHAGAKRWTVGDLGCLYKWQSMRAARLRGATWQANAPQPEPGAKDRAGPAPEGPRWAGHVPPRAGHVPPPRPSCGGHQGHLLQLDPAQPQTAKRFQSEGIPRPSPPAIAARIKCSRMG